MARSPAEKPTSGLPAARVRKNMDLWQHKLTGVKEALGAESETEAVDWAFDIVLGRERVRTAMDRAAAKGGFRDSFGRD